MYSIAGWEAARASAFLALLLFTYEPIPTKRSTRTTIAIGVQPIIQYKTAYQEGLLTNSNTHDDADNSARGSIAIGAVLVPEPK